MKHTITLETTVYNERRYSIPWIAVVKFGGSGKASYDFGQWTGIPGEKGVLTIEASTGDILALGKKDYRGKSDIIFYSVSADGQLKEIGDKGAAYKYYLKTKEIPGKEALETEKAELIKRLTEIDELLKAQFKSSQGSGWAEKGALMVKMRKCPFCASPKLEFLPRGFNTFEDAKYAGIFCMACGACGPAVLRPLSEKSYLRKDCQEFQAMKAEWEADTWRSFDEGRKEEKGR